MTHNNTPGSERSSKEYLGHKIDAGINFNTENAFAKTLGQKRLIRGIGIGGIGLVAFSVLGGLIGAVGSDSEAAHTLDTILPTTDINETIAETTPDTLPELRNPSTSQQENKIIIVIPELVSTTTSTTTIPVTTTTVVIP